MQQMQAAQFEPTSVMLSYRRASRSVLDEVDLLDLFGWKSLTQYKISLQETWLVGEKLVLVTRQKACERASRRCSI